MERLLQLFVFAVAMTMCCSFRIRAENHRNPEIPQEIHTDDYPTEYIEKLINALSPEELQRLRTLVQVEQRVSTPSSSSCPWYKHKGMKFRANALNGEEYIIIDHPKLPANIEIQKCNFTMGYNCLIDEYNDSPTLSNCCRGVPEHLDLMATPASLHEKLEGTNETGGVEQHTFYINTRCECFVDQKDADDMNNDVDVCKVKALNGL